MNDDEHSIFMALRLGLLLRTMRGTKRLNPFFRLGYMRPVVLLFSPGLYLVAFYG